MLLTTVDVVFICSLMYNPKTTNPQIKADTASMPLAASSVPLAALIEIKNEVSRTIPPNPDGIADASG
jgi:hypothetical protein